MAKSKSKSKKKKPPKNSNYKNEKIQPKVPQKQKNGKVMTEKQLEREKIKEEKAKTKIEKEKQKSEKNSVKSDDNRIKDQTDNHNTDEKKKESKTIEKETFHKTNEKSKNNNIFYIENDQEALQREKSIISGKASENDNLHETMPDTDKYMEEIHRFSQISKDSSEDASLINCDVIEIQSENEIKKEINDISDRSMIAEIDTAEQIQTVSDTDNKNIIQNEVSAHSEIENMIVENAEISNDMVPEERTSSSTSQEENTSEDQEEQALASTDEEALKEESDSQENIQEEEKSEKRIIESEIVPNVEKTDVQPTKEKFPDPVVQNKSPEKVKEKIVKAKKEKQIKIKKDQKSKDKVKKVNKGIFKRVKKDKPNKTADVQSKEKRTIKNSIIDFIKTRRIISAIVGVVLVLAIVTGTLFMTGILPFGDTGGFEVKYAGRNEPTGSVSDITSSNADQKKLVKETKGNTSRFDFFAYTDISVEGRTAALPITLGNPSYNDCVLIAYIVDDNGEKVYHSLGIENGKYISTIFIKNGLKYGKNHFTLYVTAFNTDGGKDGKSFKKLGTQHMELTVTVNGGDYDNSMLTTQANG